MSTWAILLAAGSGLRTGQPLAKQLLPYKGAPLFWHSAQSLAQVPGLHGLVFVFPPQEPGGAVPDTAYAALTAELDAAQPLCLPWRIASGGTRRQDSVAFGLKALPVDCRFVLVHDCARPFATPALARKVLDALQEGHTAVLPGIAVSDTIKIVDESSLVRSSPDRALLRAAQTPQGFALGPLLEAHDRALRENWQVTDDASLIERLGLPVHVVEGEETNRKITTAGDLALLRDDMDSMAPNPHHSPPFMPRTGFGYDVHRYGGERPLVLGGVPIACQLGVEAHSDGDVLLHALIDALLGLIGGGDIGTHFPDSDPAYDNIASGILLNEALEQVLAAGVRLCHVDLTVIAQTPRLAPHREAIRANIAKLLALPKEWVNVKATTEEGLGFTGEKKGIKAVALVSALGPGLPEAAAGPML
ncbi:2-C-methyl-D-erythritol 4-phosphate cytidylyltransferase [Desulfovibrio sp. OttesenSCG-928-F20]|nr:2-C-methyl-D-erythritol 4-phosphate cytidylyltransferase [Desulfovibrio sp. OttesenSCG-928-M16]MDL2290656.1 2-C-methyl-D-erythritol 4-phosphate cytidylyltransferase [Desulfovibrio sp. OttesenSCG-928-F20]